MPIGIKEHIEIPSAWSILVTYLQNVFQQKKLKAKQKKTVNDNVKKEQTP